jgi:hypothetical protein
MAVPEAVRKVERPKNTIVVANRGNGICKYSVIQRIGCRRVDGRNIPVNGATVGHIIGGRFVPERTAVSARTIDLKDFAEIELMDRLSSGLLAELDAVFSAADARRIYVLAMLRVAYGGMPYYKACLKYELSWVSILFPSLPMGKNSICSFLQDLGKSCALIATFMRTRAGRIAAEEHIAIDGTPKTDSSTVNSLSHYSRKARTKGTKDISVLFAYDIDTDEPVCSKVFPGNIVDGRAYEAFLRETGIRQGILMGDKGFPKGQAEEVFRENPGLSWLNPIKRSDRRIGNNRMYDYEGVLADRDHDVLYKKAKARGCYLYSFYDRKRAAKEERDYFARIKGRDGYDARAMEEKGRKFGTVVFESDLDVCPGLVYRLYDRRWLIEECFRYYKVATEFDDTKVHSDYSVIGSEFINFISSVMTMRLVREFDDTGLSRKMSYSEIMGELKSAKKARITDGGDWLFVRFTAHTEETLRILGILPRDVSPEPKKRGRPRKPVDPDRPKRRPGRPRKNPLPVQ